MEKALIRDDGVVFDWTPALAKHTDKRLYTGPIPCSQKEGLAWLQKQATGDTVVVADEAPAVEPHAVVPSAEVAVQAAAVFDPTKAGKEELLEFAEQEFGKKLNGHWGEEAIRRNVMQLMGLTPSVVAGE